MCENGEAAKKRSKSEKKGDARNNNRRRERKKNTETVCKASIFQSGKCTVQRNLFILKIHLFCLLISGDARSRFRFPEIAAFAYLIFTARVARHQQPTTSAEGRQRESERSDKKCVAAIADGMCKNEMKCAIRVDKESQYTIKYPKRLTVPV